MEDKDINVLEDFKKINFNHNESKYENSSYKQALENLLQAYKEDEKLIKEMAKEICFKEPLRYNNAEEVIDYFRKECNYEK